MLTGRQDNGQMAIWPIRAIQPPMAFTDVSIAGPRLESGSRRSAAVTTPNSVKPAARGGGVSGQPKQSVPGSESPIAGPPNWICSPGFDSTTCPLRSRTPRPSCGGQRARDPGPTTNHASAIRIGIGTAPNGWPGCGSMRRPWRGAGGFDSFPVPESWPARSSPVDPGSFPAPPPPCGGADCPFHGATGFFSTDYVRPRGGAPGGSSRPPRTRCRGYAWTGRGKAFPGVLRVGRVGDRRS